MSHKLDGMAVIASGQSATIRRWSTVLWKAAIQHAIVRLHYDDPYAPMDHAEIWVERDDAERARAALRQTRSEQPALA